MLTKPQVAANSQTRTTDLDVILPVGYYCPHPPSPFIIITPFTIPQMVEAKYHLGTAVRACNPCPKLYMAFVISTTVRGWF